MRRGESKALSRDIRCVLWACDNLEIKHSSTRLKNVSCNMLIGKFKIILVPVRKKKTKVELIRIHRKAFDLEPYLQRKKDDQSNYLFRNYLFPLAPCTFEDLYPPRHPDKCHIRCLKLLRQAPAGLHVTLILDSSRVSSLKIPSLFSSVQAVRCTCHISKNDVAAIPLSIWIWRPFFSCNIWKQAASRIFLFHGAIQ